MIRQLGEELVTDGEQAILELIKNSYDADAEWVRLLVDTSNGQSSPQKKPGLIRVEDNGCGMTLPHLHNGWLRISLSLKRKIKASGKKSDKGRTPLGDKGLGRLSTMKLGDVVEIQTYPSKTTAVQISWAEQRRLLKTREKASPKGCSGDQVAALDKIEIMLLSQLGLHSRQ